MCSIGRVTASAPYRGARQMAGGLDLDDQVLDPSWSWVVPIDQPQYRLVKALFERQTEFQDSTFYDISTWTMPLAFGTVSTRLSTAQMSSGLVGDPIDIVTLPTGRFTPDSEAYAYLFEWSSYFAPRALYRLLEEGFHPRVATRTFQAETLEGPRDFSLGTIIVPAADESRRADLEELLELAAKQDAIDVWATRSGLTSDGVDLGSPAIWPLSEIRPLLVSGPGTSSYEVGEAWYLLDHRFGIAVSLVERDSLGSIDLGDYTHVMMVDGSYDDLDEGATSALRKWVSSGGVLVATKNAAVWAGDVLMGEPAPEGETSGDGTGAVDISSPSAETPEPEGERRRYGDFDHERAAQLLSGAIFEVELDRTHPMAFGFSSDRLPVFRNSTMLLEDSDNPYERVAIYAEEPRLSGYVSDEKLAEFGGQPAILVSKLGDGTVVQMADNPNFRAFWYGTSKLYLNAIFLGQIVESTSSPSDW